MVEKSVEKIYQKKTQLEHVLLRPDTYVGSTEKIDQILWIFDEKTEKFKEKKISYTPALYKIFDEVLVNAADNYQRDKKTSQIKVNINQAKNSISIYNNGSTVPVVIHKEHKCYVPELVFGKILQKLLIHLGHLLTSSNYDDTEKKTTGGRNGFGAKLTNIFSKKFTVEIGDSKNKKHYKQEFTNNLQNVGEPTISPYSPDQNDYIIVTFQPDLKRFGMKELENDIVGLLKKRVYDLAGTSPKSVKVYLNEKKLEIETFEQYVDLYFNKTVPQKFYEKCGPRWEICVAVLDLDQFQQVSFVNSICTVRGGQHVNHVSDQIVNNLLEAIQKKHKKIELKPFQIRQNLWVFINALIENPAFDSQTKETLTSRLSTFGSRCDISEKFLSKIAKSGIIEDIVAKAEMKEAMKLKKELGTGVKKKKLFGIPKLEDANLAGTSESESCILILTEGDSAKSLAMSGLQVVGRDRFGVFPLRGKLLNVRDCGMKQILDNEEIQNIIKILGLYMGRQYDDLKTLRYGSIMIMADQDHDGSHIKGLIINFIHNFWPSLIKKFPTFVKEFVTPIIKATSHNECLQFFTIAEYEKWAQLKGTNELKSYRIKYYKGLGTSTALEAKQYFQSIKKHQINFYYKDDKDEDKILLAFSKTKADDRKNWLSQFNPNIYVDHSKNKLCYAEFVDQELIHFSIADNMRSIPSVMDGLKPGQRKILFACFKRKLKAEIKVAQLSGYIAEHTAYHHGEISLQMTIINMAQDFVGSNNLNLLQPIGQFGTRMMGGKESASPRYIYTNLTPFARSLFNENDDPLLKYQIEEGMGIEPEFYVPVLPLVLINGAEGIGTGWSTYIPCFSPIHIIHNIKRHLEGKPFLRMQPWYKGFTGQIEPKQNDESGLSYIDKGKFKVDKERNKLIITELPLQKWTREYKNFLEELAQKDEIIDIKEFHQDNTVHFEVKFNRSKLDIGTLDDDQIEKKFKLTSNLNCTNLVLFDRNCKIKKYENECQILEEFFNYRLNLYKKRKESMLKIITEQYEKLSNKYRFVASIIDGSLEIYKKKKEDVVKLLKEKGFKTYQEIHGHQKQNLQQVENQPQEKQGKDAKKNFQLDKRQDYNYLLNMKIFSFVEDQLVLLKTKMNEIDEKRQDLQRKTPEDLWRIDLDQVQALYEDTMSKTDKIITQDIMRIKHKEWEGVQGNQIQTKVERGNVQQNLRAKDLEEENKMEIDEDLTKEIIMPKAEHRVVTKVTQNGITPKSAKDSSPLPKSTVRQVSIKKSTDKKSVKSKNDSESESEFEETKSIKSGRKQNSKAKSAGQSSGKKAEQKKNQKKRSRKNIEDSEDSESSEDSNSSGSSLDESSFSAMSDSDFDSKPKRNTRSMKSEHSGSKNAKDSLTRNSKLAEKINSKQKEQELKQQKSINSNSSPKKKLLEEEVKQSSKSDNSLQQKPQQQKLAFQQQPKTQGTLDQLFDKSKQVSQAIDEIKTVKKEEPKKEVYEMSIQERVAMLKLQGTSSSGKQSQGTVEAVSVATNYVKANQEVDLDKSWVNIGEDEEEEIPISRTNNKKRAAILDDDE